MDVFIGIPWRDSGWHRRRNYRHVRAHLSTVFPAAELRSFDTGSDVFNRAAARNAAARAALEAGADVLVLNDADTVAEAWPLTEAVHQVTDRVHLPYNYYRSLSKQGTTDYLNGAPAERCEIHDEHPWATGGVIVCRPQVWFQGGGMDERFEGWGFEDTAARTCWDAILGETVRHTGHILHLWHPPDTFLGSPRWWANRKLMDRYEQATGDRDTLEKIIAERGGG